jgi:hypothetical protein
MGDPLTNPPVPEWNSLTNEERSALCRIYDMYGCRCCEDNDLVFYLYLEIRKVLQGRERRYLEATMAGPPAEHTAHS